MTQEADEQAMIWARATVESLASSNQWRHLLYYGEVDLRPLLVNRLFRGLFIDGARVFLSAKRLIREEDAKKVVIYDGGGLLAQFAVLGCVQENSTPEIQNIASTQTFGKLLPDSLRTFIYEIAYPTIKNIGQQPSGLHKKRSSKIVFIKRGEIEIEMVKGAFSLLSKREDLELLVVAFDSQQHVSNETSFHTKPWHEYYTFRQMAKLLNYQIRVMMQRSLPQHWSTGDLALLSKPILRFTKRVALPSIAHTLGTVEEIISDEEPSLFVSVDETGLLGKTMASQGKLHEVPTLNVQHGVRSDSPWIEDQLYDRFAIFGAETQRVFSLRGNNPNIFICTGVPRYDVLFRRIGLKSRSEVASELGLDPRRKIITFASQRSWGHMTSAVKQRTLVSFVHAWRETDAQLVVKLRSGQDDYIPDEVLEIPGWESACLTINYDLYDLLNASDLVVTAWSTVGMEAIALGKPLLIINLTGQPDHIPYVADGVALGVYNAEDVRSRLSQMLTLSEPIANYEENRKEFIKRHMTSADGHSSERLADLMLSMIPTINES